MGGLDVVEMTAHTDFDAGSFVLSQEAAEWMRLPQLERRLRSNNAQRAAHPAQEGDGEDAFDGSDSEQEVEEEEEESEACVDSEEEEGSVEKVLVKADSGQPNPNR